MAHPDSASRTDRAQTAIDFVVGMGVFLLAAAFVLLFVPSMFAPFFGAGIGDPVTADRAANYLVEDRLALEGEPTGVLSTEKQQSFFEDCDEDALLDALAIEHRSVNVSVGDDTCGPEPEGSVTVSQRLVELDGEHTMLDVRLW